MPSEETPKRNKGQTFSKAGLPAREGELQSVQAEEKTPKARNRTDHSKEKQKMPAIIAPGFGNWLQIWLPIIFSGLVVIVIVVQAYIYHQQRKVMDKQLHTMNETLTDTIVGQRAYVAVKEIHLGQPLKGVDKAEFRITFENEGNTPAVNVRIHMNWKLLQDEPGTFETIPSDKPPNQAIMLPKVPFHMVNGFTSKASDREVWAAQGFNLYFWGTVDYEDVFRQQHRTHFCLHTFSMSDVAVGPCAQNNYFEY